MRPVIQLLNKILHKETKFNHTIDEMKRKKKQNNWKSSCLILEKHFLF